MTDTYENITFSQLRLRELIIFVAISCVGLLLSMRVANRLIGIHAVKKRTNEIFPLPEYARVSPSQLKGFSHEIATKDLVVQISSLQKKDKKEYEFVLRLKTKGLFTRNLFSPCPLLPPLKFGIMPMEME